jgi:Ca2+:H+ antiporter
MLFFSYIIGLLFTLRTHAATIWTEPDAQEKKILEMSASSLSQSGHMDYPHSSLV